MIYPWDDIVLISIFLLYSYFLYISWEFSSSFNDAMQIFLYLRHKQSQYFLRSDFTSDYNELATPFKMRLKEGKILEKRVATQCLESFIRNISQKVNMF